MTDNQTLKAQPSPFYFKKILNHIKQFFSKSSNCIIVFFGIVLTITVIYPLFSMVKDSFTVQSVSEAKNINEIWDAAVKRGDFTFLQWPSLLFNKLTPLYSKNFFWIPLYRSVLMALIACTIAVVFGGNLAFFITRTNIPFKRFISTVFVFPYIMPSWSIAMFWENFFKNTNVSGSPGEGLLQALTGISAPQWLVYGFFPTAIVLGLHYAPFAYILIGGILRNMDANLEEAATILKASRLKIVRRITLLGTDDGKKRRRLRHRNDTADFQRVDFDAEQLVYKKPQELYDGIRQIGTNHQNRFEKSEVAHRRYDARYRNVLCRHSAAFVRTRKPRRNGRRFFFDYAQILDLSDARNRRRLCRRARLFSERHVSQQHDFAFVRQNHHRRRHRFVYLRNLRYFDRIRRQQKQEKSSCQLRFQFGVLAVLDSRVEFQHDFLFTVEDECVSFFGRCDDAQRMVSRRAVHHRRRNKVFALCVAQRNERDAAGFG